MTDPTTPDIDLDAHEQLVPEPEPQPDPGTDQAETPLNRFTVTVTLDGATVFRAGVEAADPAEAIGNLAAHVAPPAPPESPPPTTDQDLKDLFSAMSVPHIEARLAQLESTVQLLTGFTTAQLSAEAAERLRTSRVREFLKDFKPSPRQDTNG